MGPFRSVGPRAWLRSVAGLVLTAEPDELTLLWNVAPRVRETRHRITSREIPPDLRVWLGLAQGLVGAAKENQGDGMLEEALVIAAQVMSQDISTRFAAIGMLVLLSPPLAKASTFEDLCRKLEEVPGGESDCAV